MSQRLVRTFDRICSGTSYRKGKKEKGARGGTGGVPCFTVHRAKCRSLRNNFRGDPKRNSIGERREGKPYAQLQTACRRHSNNGSVIPEGGIFIGRIA